MGYDPSFVYDEKDRIDTLLEQREPPSAQLRAVIFRANGEVGARTKPGDLGAVKSYASSLRRLYPTHRIVIQWCEGEKEMWEDWSVVPYGVQRGAG